MAGCSVYRRLTRVYLQDLAEPAQHRHDGYGENRNGDEHYDQRFPGESVSPAFATDVGDIAYVECHEHRLSTVSAM